MRVDDARALAELVTRRRRQLRLTQQELADLAQVSVRAVSQLESGESSMTFKKLMAILSVLGLSLTIEVKTVGN